MDGIENVKLLRFGHTLSVDFQILKTWTGQK